MQNFEVPRESFENANQIMGRLSLSYSLMELFYCTINHGNFVRNCAVVLHKMDRDKCCNNSGKLSPTKPEPPHFTYLNCRSA